MIDKADGRIPCDTPFRSEFNRVYSDLRYEPAKDPFRPSRLYHQVADLRPYGHDVVLHLSCKRGKYGHHKIEVVDTGAKPYSQIVKEIEDIFEINGERVELMRLDLAVDIQGIPVNWFQQRVKANHKRYIASLGVTPYTELGMGGLQTLYFGKRPNLVRIYDKVQECRVQYEQIKRNRKSDEPLPSFEDLFGIPESGYVLTRVERQFGGGRIPEDFVTVADLRKLVNFRPFEKVMVLDGGLPEPNPSDYSFMVYCTGMYLRDMAAKQGMHTTDQFIKRHSNGNAKWARDKFRDFLPECHPSEMVNSDFLNERFQRSVSRQLAA